MYIFTHIVYIHISCVCVFVCVHIHGNMQCAILCSRRRAADTYRERVKEREGISCRHCKALHRHFTGAAGGGCWRRGVALLTAPLGEKPKPDGVGAEPRGGSRTTFTSNTGLQRLREKCGNANEVSAKCKHDASVHTPAAVLRSLGAA